MLLNQGNYEPAIKILEPRHAANPQDPEVNKKLLHAYAGAGGFEALKVVSIAKEVENLFKEFKLTQEDDAKKELKAQALILLTQLEKALEPIPNLTQAQKNRLDQAINFYGEIGLKLETAGNYNNFKWGTLHVWRLAVNLKELISELKVQSTQDLDIKMVEKIVLPRVELMGQDLFKTYQLYSHSFDKIKKITDGLNKIIGKTINDKDFKLKVSTLATSEGEFYEQLAKDNIKVASSILNKISDLYRTGGYEKGVKVTTKKNLPSEAEILESGKRIETLVKVFVEGFAKENPEIEAKLRSIFTEQLKVEIIEAAKLSIKQRNTQPLALLLDSKRPELEPLKGYYLVLTQQIKSSDLEESVKEEIEALKKKVDLELLKAELKVLSQDFNKELAFVEQDGNAAFKKSSEKIEARKGQLRSQIKELEDYLNDLGKEYQEGLNIPSSDKVLDKQDAEKISKEIKEFVE